MTAMMAISSQGRVHTPWLASTGPQRAVHVAGGGQRLQMDDHPTVDLGPHPRDANRDPLAGTRRQHRDGLARSGLRRRAEQLVHGHLLGGPEPHVARVAHHV